MRLMQTSPPSADYFRYWGKASPRGEGCAASAAPEAAFHLLPYHCLDVAAVGEVLLTLPGWGLGAWAEEGGMGVQTWQRLAVFFLALHDLGKFAPGFQNLVPHPGSALVPFRAQYPYGGDVRHDTLGWMAWRALMARKPLPCALPSRDRGAWDSWMLAMTGHHGAPPHGQINGRPVHELASRYWDGSDLDAAAGFMQAVTGWLLPPDIPQPDGALARRIKAASWHLAGLAVLADWLGSHQAFFPYRSTPMDLEAYWREHAQPQARRAVEAAGLLPAAVRPFTGPADLFDYLRQPTPLQHYAATVELMPGPQLFILEDVTGAGKTEAALILAQRLMGAGRGQGVYFGLPSMATSNQMYQRVGGVFRRLFEASARPNLVLAHGARHLVDGFAQSATQGDADYARDEASASGVCAAWLADTNKKALLAEVGVGTLDQALLAILPAKHQSLRLFGLVGKVLILDEIHAYDTYTGQLLAALLEAHARQGGSAVLLSATLPAALRTRLIQAFQTGRGDACPVPSAPDPAQVPYPLATRVAEAVCAEALATRPQVARRLPVAFVHEPAAAHALIRKAVAQGQCVAWIRNTVDDARQAWEELRASPDIDPERLMLFHSRYALADRLAIEGDALRYFGKDARAEVRRGRVLVATQVIEQSLDLDLDLMISDLAPVDLLIQRAGRLHRHLRDAQGNPAAQDGRPAPTLWVLAPPWSDTPEADWYGRMFKGANAVYPHTGQLWLSQKVLQEAGALQMPEGARALIEGVYDFDALGTLPPGLQDNEFDQSGKQTGDRNLARFNTLQWALGYTETAGAWSAEEKTPTRLGEYTQEWTLLRVVGACLEPWVAETSHPWEASSIKLALRSLKALEPAWEARFHDLLEALKTTHPALRHRALLPLVAAEGAGGEAPDVWIAQGQNAKGQTVQVRYCPRLGLRC